jgi:GNAT superfamily N-acetyltransferase
MTIEYKVMGFREVWPLIKDLVALQWEEVDHRAKESKLAVVEETYNSMEDLGLHYTVVAIGEDDKIFGYASMMITDNPHTSEKTALSDTMYISKEMRGEGYGADLIVAAEEEAIALGAVRVCITLKNTHNHDSLIEPLGYYSYETTYSKFLKDV